MRLGQFGPRTAIALAVLVGALAVGVQLGASRPVGLSRDSVDYLQTARSMRSGHGLTEPVPSYNEAWRPGINRAVETNFPPLYPAVLAAGSRLTNHDPLAVARWLATLCVASSLALGFVCGARAGRTSWAGLAVVALLATSYDLAWDHLMVWTEPVFITLLLACVLLLGRFNESPTPARAAAAAGVAALLGLTRLIGVGAAVAVIAVAIRHAHGPSRRKTIGLAAVGVLPPAVAFVGQRLARGAASRTLDWHAPTTAELRAVVAVGRRWLLPSQPSQAVLMLAALLVLAVIGIAARRRRVTFAPATGAAAALAASLLVLIAVTRFLVDAAILDQPLRMLSPLHVLVVIAAIGLLPSLAGDRGAGHDRVLVAGATALTALVVLSGVSATRGFVANASTNGAKGYADASWSSSPTLAAALRVPPGIRVLTDGPDLLYARGGRRAAAVPPRLDLRADRRNSRLDADLRVAAAWLGPAGVVVWFDELALPFLPDEAHVVRALGLQLVAEYPDGAIYRRS